MTKQLLQQSKYFTKTLNFVPSKVQKPTIKKSKKLQAQLDKLAEQAERSRPLINLPRTNGPKPSNKNIKQTFEANDLDVDSKLYDILFFTNINN
jgi:hypothetical protein